MEERNIKEKILKGSEELFMKYGVRSISMDDIARHLSVSKKTLYQHFADKDDMVASVVQSHMYSEKAKYDQIASTATNSIEELGMISACMRRDLESVNPSLLFDIHKFHPKAWSVWNEHKEKFIRESVVRNLEQGKQEGYFRPEINSDILASLRLITIEAGFNDQYFPKSKFSLVDVQSQIFDHFVFGLCTEKGRKLYTKYKENSQSPHTTNHKHETIL